MNIPDELRLSLHGGPLHRAGVRLGLVRGDGDTTRLGFALCAALWGVLAALSLSEGAAGLLFSVALVGSHVRLLAALPLLFLCERWLSPCVTEFVAGLRRSGVVHEDDGPALAREVARARRLVDGWIPDAVCVAAAFAAIAIAGRVGLFGHSAAQARGADPGFAAPLTAGWYWYVCLPVFRFFVFRLAWRLLVWWGFLWRVSRLGLRLEPTHPDAAGGLGYLEVVQTQFLPLIAALSCVQCAGFAEDISTGRIELADTAPYAVFVLCIGGAITIVPLLFFCRRLFECRTQGLSRYMQFASDYVARFDAKWLRDRAHWGDSMLGTPDLQSLSDLGASAERVAATRILVMTRGTVALVAASALVPMLPLLLFEYPAAELAEKFVRLLAGL